MLLATLLATSVSARSSAERAVERGLAETNARITEQLHARQAELAGRMTVFAQNRNVVGVITNDTSGGDVLDQAGQLVEATGAQWVQITDGDGFRIAKSDEPAATRIDLKTSSLVRGALDGKTTPGFGTSGDTALLQLVAVPLLRDLADSHSVVGVTLAAQRVGDSLAHAIGERTGSQVSFFALDAKGAPHVAGSTLEAADREALQHQLAERMMKNVRERTEITLGGDTYVGQGTPVNDAAGIAVGGFLALRSLDAELAGYYKLRRTLLLTGVLGLLLAFVLSSAITKRIVSPVTALVAATRRAADGDYAAEIPAGGSDEIGTLAGAVRRLLADLRDKQALVDFLSTGSGAGATAIRRNDPDATALMPSAAAIAGGALQVGQTLGQRYDIKALLGAGGMGMVYRATDRELHETVAIKTLKQEIIAADATALERFKSEIRLARKISHRNVVRTHDLGESHGVYFITMEYVEGTSLKDLVGQRGRIPVHVMLPIAKQLCRALEVAHEAGVIHRDIKPHNMVVERDGTLKVMDFGIARLATRAPSQGLTEAGMVVGTPEYMSPEQLLGDELDARADIYSAGVVLYECLTGQLPFDAPSPIVLISRVLEETPTAPHVLHDDIPVALGTLVMRAMSRDRDARPISAEALHNALEHIG